MFVTHALAEFARDLGALAPGAVQATRRCVLDLLGAAAAGFATTGPRAMRVALAGLFAPGPSTAWLSGLHLAPAAAALLNAEAASALDLDDGIRAAGGHPGASIIPAAVAVAQETGASGEAFLRAVALGYEAAVRIAAARDPARLDTFSTGRWCAYGAALAGGVLRGLPTETLAGALGVAGVQSPGLSAAGYSRLMGNHVKEGIPWATMTGLAALDLAASGFSGPDDILDHPDYYDVEKILAGLGEVPLAIESVYFKPYSCCRWAHAAIDALLGLMAAHDLRASELRAVRVETFGRALRLSNETDPKTLEGAQYSVPFVLAAAAVGGPETLLPMRGNLLGRQDVVALAGRVSLHAGPAFEAMFPARTAAKVRVETPRGVFEATVLDPSGDPANPLSDAALEIKFRTLSRGVLSPARQDVVVAAVAAFEAGGLPSLMAALAAPPGA